MLSRSLTRAAGFSRAFIVLLRFYLIFMKLQRNQKLPKGGETFAVQVVNTFTACRECPFPYPSPCTTLPHLPHEGATVNVAYAQRMHLI